MITKVMYIERRGASLRALDTVDDVTRSHRVGSGQIHLLVNFNYGPGDTNFHVGGLIMSTIGAMIVLGIYSRSARRSGSA